MDEKTPKFSSNQKDEVLQSSESNLSDNSSCLMRKVDQRIIYSKKSECSSKKCALKKKEEELIAEELRKSKRTSISIDTNEAVRGSDIRYSFEIKDQIKPYVETEVKKNHEENEEKDKISKTTPKK